MRSSIPLINLFLYIAFLVFLGFVFVCMIGAESVKAWSPFSREVLLTPRGYPVNYSPGEQTILDELKAIREECKR